MLVRYNYDLLDIVSPITITSGPVLGWQGPEQRGGAGLIPPVANNNFAYVTLTLGKGRG